MILHFVWFSALLCSSPKVWAYAEVANTSGNSLLRAQTDLGTNLIGTSAAELSCLWSKADPEVKPDDAETTAKGLEAALKKMKFEPGEMNRASLLHFMSQSLAETGHLQSTQQKGEPPQRTGWGLIQVTGDGNLEEARECMDKCSPPDGQNMMANKPAVVGDKASDRTAAALMSLCWWKKNVVQNRKHDPIAKTASADASRDMTYIINTGGLPAAGGVKRTVTGGEKNLAKREKYFTNLMNVDKEGTCRKI